MKKFGYRATSIVLLFAAMWVLDIRVQGLRLLAGGALVVISLSFWDAGKNLS